MNELLKFARQTIQSKLEDKEPNVTDSIMKRYSDEHACFVTLTKGEDLRGCIGSLQPHQELWKDVMDNSINAAFRDPRFSPITKKELPEIKIEISVLSIPKRLNYKDEEDLLKQIKPSMGLILRKAGTTATFLPQVWEEIPDKKDFLEHLSRKAWLPKDGWKNADFWYYTVEKFKD